jgi:hypothetical protein
VNPTSILRIYIFHVRRRFDYPEIYILASFYLYCRGLVDKLLLPVTAAISRIKTNIRHHHKQNDHTASFPLFKRIGILWVIDHVKVAQEHLVSNIIHQKMIVGIEDTHTPTTSNKAIILFLPEGTDVPINAYPDNVRFFALRYM